MIADPAAAVVVLDPVRARLLGALREPASAATLATKVGLTRQKVNYHLRQLEAHGLVEAAGTRVWGGLTERLLVATAGGYVVAPEPLGEPVGGPDRLSAAYLIAVAARAVREVGALARRAARADRTLPVLALDAEIRFATPDDRAAFADELAAAVSTLAAKYHDEKAPGGRWQRLLVAVHPRPKDVA
ncbi:helix-turn-helix protein [Actinophytocola oryzae]|uniref:Helix-turn-helix protein n=1 Tax=Actinophytocola oryzae TaxID=502181 RepID=A0A4R7VFL9_9PSEU|nr:helix-turn-helix protein [Actinophytocola oryzae]